MSLKFKSYVSGQLQVNCGGHDAISCSECPQEHGHLWCNGDCEWFNEECTLKVTPVSQIIEQQLLLFFRKKPILHALIRVFLGCVAILAAAQPLNSGLLLLSLSSISSILQ